MISTDEPGFLSKLLNYSSEVIFVKLFLNVINIETDMYHLAGQDS